jgi:hypothetical protein
MNGEKDENLLRDLGAKLANFRRKLAVAIGQKKITQAEFGEMFGGQTPRMITSYERGEVDLPGSLLFLIWKSGNSVDGIFNEDPITEPGKHTAARLYADCSLVNLHQLDNAGRERLFREVDGDNAYQVRTTKETPAKISGKTKTGHGATRANKKRRGAPSLRNTKTLEKTKGPALAPEASLTYLKA